MSVDAASGPNVSQSVAGRDRPGYAGRHVQGKTAWLTTGDVARLLQVSEETVRRWRTLRRKGRATGPPFYKMNSGGDARKGSVRYRRSDVEEWLAAERVG